MLSAIAFLIWLAFFDRNDFFAQYERSKKLKELKESSHYYDVKINDAATELRRREADPAAFEKLAREKYYMRKPGEDLYIFEE
ncbi:MAG: septum formation initiator family protein [Bacteroidetes bacterium]|nr:septum formation initiator family protein [Bacteroidota bacterium]